MVTRLCMLILISMLAIAAHADICEDINSLANDWNDVANFVDDIRDNDYFTDRELDILERYVTELAEDTYFLADALIDLGNNRETKLGVAMRKTMSQLADARDQDEMVRLLDKLVDIIDRTTDYCDG